MASIGQTITGPRFHETDEVSVFPYVIFFAYRGVQWFDRQRAYLDSLESQLRSLVKAIDTVARHRAGEHACSSLIYHANLLRTRTQN